MVVAFLMTFEGVHGFLWCLRTLDRPETPMLSNFLLLTYLRWDRKSSDNSSSLIKSCKDSNRRAPNGSLIKILKKLKNEENPSSLLWDWVKPSLRQCSSARETFYWFSSISSIVSDTSKSSWISWSNFSRDYLSFRFDFNWRFSHKSIYLLSIGTDCLCHSSPWLLLWPPPRGIASQESGRARSSVFTTKWENKVNIQREKAFEE